MHTQCHTSCCNMQLIFKYDHFNDMSLLIYHNNHQYHCHDRYLFYNYYSSILFFSLVFLLRDDFALYYLVFFLFVCFFFPLVCLVLVCCFVCCFICFFACFFAYSFKNLKQWVGCVEITLMDEHLVSVSYSFALIWYVIRATDKKFYLGIE